MYEIVSAAGRFWVEKDGARVSARYPTQELAEAEKALLENAA